MNDLFYLTDDQRAIRELARKLARDRIARFAADVDERERYPEESIKALIDAGLYGIWVPDAYGGTDMGCLALALVAEEIAWACAATATQYVDQPLGGLPILLAGTEAQKQKYLPRLASGELLAAYSLSEPGAGSDAAALATTAIRTGDTYVLNGAKQWCTNGDHADVICVFATVDRSKGAAGVTAFLVEKDAPGFSVGKKERKMGIRGSPTVALHFNDCVVPAEQRLGAEGEGFKIAMRTLDITRPATGAMAVGIGQAAIDAAVDYAKERRLRRLRVYARLPGRAVHARRQDHADLRGHQPDPAADHREGAAQLTGAISSRTSRTRAMLSGLLTTGRPVSSRKCWVSSLIVSPVMNATRRTSAGRRSLIHCQTTRPSTSGSRRSSSTRS